MHEVPTFVDEHLLRVGELEFHCDLYVGKAPSGHFPVMKPRPLVERYVELADELRPKTIVELGIRLGGSTVLMSELYHPDTLVALELDETPVRALETYIADHTVGDRVRPCYGVNQADRDRVEQILDAEMRDRPIDLVIDDASHRYAETVASFEVLFPRLRTGGLYVIEDWTAEHRFGDALRASLRDPDAPAHEQVRARIQTTLEERARQADARPTPLLQLAFELVLARASTGDVIREVTVNEHWFVVQRGDSPLDPATFRLRDHVHDHFGLTANFTDA